jgi:hypothetical protein
MPYIKQAERRQYDKALDELSSGIFTSGQLTYVLYKLCLNYVNRNAVCYLNYAAIMGALTCVIQEFYRKEVAEYEDDKELENGRVF